MQSSIHIFFLDEIEFVERENWIFFSQRHLECWPFTMTTFTVA
jgi:hypothetical protein